jgi:nucleoside phosphorylase
MRQSRTPSTARNKRWLVVSAWPPELDFFRAQLARLPARVRRRVTTAAVGVGLVDAGIGTMRALAAHEADTLILVGTAGAYPGYTRRYPIGTVVLAASTSLLPHACAGDPAFMPEVMRSRIELSSALARGLGFAARLPRASLACPVGITATNEAARAAARRSGCAIENLEAFSVASAAAAAKTPFVAVLGIANRVGTDAHQEWLKNGACAAERACQAVLDALQSASPSC